MNVTDTITTVYRSVVWSVNDKKATLCTSHITILKWQMLYVARLMKKEEKNVTNLEEKETSDTVNDKS